MSCYNGAEVCELFSIYLLNQVKVVIAKENMVLYRHDCLGIFKMISAPEAERKKKELVKIFKNNGLSMTIKANLKTAKFLDLYLD